MRGICLSKLSLTKRHLMMPLQPNAMLCCLVTYLDVLTFLFVFDRCHVGEPAIARLRELSSESATVYSGYDVFKDGH
ncbi:hypothetical protein VNO80_18531 [Phaseolus coccineus]|uniref:Uncharacterized protein n=1 Tax=Phaseolus coccineus TaxID=3886 RepID=A0AAN9MEC1_PHACN